MSSSFNLKFNPHQRQQMILTDEQERNYQIQIEMSEG